MRRKLIFDFLNVLFAYILWLFGLGPLPGTTNEPCNNTGRAPTPSDTIVARFLAFGDTPYDRDAPYPYQGTEYNCLQNTIIPKVVNSLMSNNDVDFVAHVGDVKGGVGFADVCDNTVFGNRRTLFEAFESGGLDFIMVPGDNEWNDCSGYNFDPTVADPVKTRWRQFFVDGQFTDFDRVLPFGGAVTLERDPAQSQNFFFYYDNEDIAFLGITEPLGDDAYNSINANFVASKLASKSPNAVVVIGHADLSSDVRTILPNVPILYVKGNDHSFCAEPLDSNLLALTVDDGTAAPLQVSILKSPSNEYSFFIETTSYSC